MTHTQAIERAQTGEGDAIIEEQKAMGSSQGQQRQSPSPGAQEYQLQGSSSGQGQEETGEEEDGWAECDKCKKKPGRKCKQCNCWVGVVE
ncbi:MAG: hypothetical protein GY820_32175 [Gammaproteobacteria bacterium]|nr:hypothetical protein [Gammaproteobacteria bacterium]